MPIVTSVIEQQRLQRNGSVFVREAHTDHVGKVRKRAYRAAAGTDINALMLARVPQVEADAKAGELQAIEKALKNGATLAQVKAKKEWNTNSEIGTWLFKRLANRLPDVTQNSIENDLPGLFLLKAAFAETTDAQIASLLAVPVADITAWRASFDTMKAAIGAYGHTLPFFDGVD